MIIAVDGNEANVEKRVGVSTYTLELLSYFAAWADQNTRFRVFLRTAPGPWMPRENEFFRYETVWGPVAWSQFFLPLRLLLTRRPHVFFAPAHYAPRYCPAPLVVTIHDLAYLYYPEEFLPKDRYKLTRWTKYAVERAVSVIAVSQTTKKDIIKTYQIPESLVRVVYNGFTVKHTNIDTEDVLRKHDLVQDEYVLFVGTIQPRKNIPALLDAFQILASENPALKLVLVGKKGWLFQPTLDHIEKLGLTDRVILTGHVSDYDLDVLYHNALCFVLPSKYEGFGIPILEAMAHQCPVIVSHSSSLPEIAGDAAFYFAAEDPSALAEKISLLINNPDMRKKLISAGNERVAGFSWEQCAKQTLEILQSAVCI